MARQTQNDDRKVVPLPRSPGFSARKHRIERALAQYEEKFRQENPAWDTEQVSDAAAQRVGALIQFPGASHLVDRWDRELDRIRGAIRTTDPQLDPAEVEQRALAELEHLLKTHDAPVSKQMELTRPSLYAPRRDGLFEKIEIAALRRLDYVRCLEAALAKRGGGGPRTDYRVPIAVFERNAFEKGRPELRAAIRDFQGSDRLLDWAYEDPIHSSNSGCSPSAVSEALGSILNRNHPGILLSLNVEAFKELAETDPDAGRYVVIDGTDVPVSRDQGPAYGAEQERLVQRGMSLARLASHGESKNWRGPTLLIATCIKLNKPIAWLQIPGGAREFKHAAELVRLIFELWGDDCPLEYLVGDKEYDDAELIRELEECYGVHLVTPWRRHKDEQPGAAAQGTPTCSCGTHPQPMKLHQAEGFWPPTKRRENGLRPGDRVDLKKTKARFRWHCVHDGRVTATTYFHHDPRRHPFLPRAGEHKWRVALRTALLLRRNAGESLNMQLKHRGIAGRGVEVSRWVTTDQEQDWLIGAALLGITLRGVVHACGLYKDAEDEALARGLIKLDGTGQGRRSLVAHAALATAA